LEIVDRTCLLQMKSKCALLLLKLEKLSLSTLEKAEKLCLYFSWWLYICRYMHM
jgi:hypothetical protein